MPFNEKLDARIRKVVAGWIHFLSSRQSRIYKNKSEARNPKCETNSKSAFSGVLNCMQLGFKYCNTEVYFYVLNFCHLIFGFVSNFEGRIRYFCIRFFV